MEGRTPATDFALGNSQGSIDFGAAAIMFFLFFSFCIQGIHRPKEMSERIGEYPASGGLWLKRDEVRSCWKKTRSRCQATLSLNIM